MEAAAARTVLLFSPVVYPITQLPQWLADAHRVLPIYPMAQIMRASVTSGLVHDVAASYAVLAAWTVAAWTATAWVIGRRINSGLASASKTGRPR